LNDFTIICNIIKKSLELKLDVIKKTQAFIGPNKNIRRSQSVSKIFLTDSIDRFFNKKLLNSRSCKSNQNIYEEVYNKKFLKMGKSIYNHRFTKNSNANYKLKKYEKKFLFDKESNGNLFFSKTLNYTSLDQENILYIYCQSLDNDTLTSKA